VIPFEVPVKHPESPAILFYSLHVQVWRDLVKADAPDLPQR